MNEKKNLFQFSTTNNSISISLCRLRVYSSREEKKKNVIAVDYLFFAWSHSISRRSSNRQTRRMCESSEMNSNTFMAHWIERWASVRVIANSHPAQHRVYYGYTKRVCVICRICSGVVRLWDMNNVSPSSLRVCFDFSWCRMPLLCLTHRHPQTHGLCIVWQWCSLTVCWYCCYAVFQRHISRQCERCTGGLKRAQNQFIQISCRLYFNLDGCAVRHTKAISRTQYALDKDIIWIFFFLFFFHENLLHQQ